METPASLQSAGFVNTMVAKWHHLFVPVGLMSLLLVLVVPMPPVMLDIMIAGNISLAAVILLTTIYMRKPLDFSAFPSILLGATLFRLVLNVATTRLILAADASTPEAAQGAAGQVVQSFGTFVAGSSIIVGAIIFLILVIVQFVVITKGATRMSEVAARFTLDAMPGKQMAIDADLSAGLIGEAEARTRRDTITSEADFYGAMDGASKFVRGDAIAGIIITLINIIGGLAIGIFIKGWTAAATVETFTKLTIGDGLASQIPSFIVAIAAALIIARSGEHGMIGTAIPKQLVSQPLALYLVAIFLLVLSVTPLPTFPLLTAATVLSLLAFFATRAAAYEAHVQIAAEAASPPPEAESSVDGVLGLDVMEIEIGYGLVQLVDSARGGDLLDRIGMIRRQLAMELGLVVPPIRIRDNMQLESSAYAVRLRGAVIGRGIVHAQRLMAMNSGVASGEVDGIAGVEPAFGLEVTWIDPADRARAQTANWTVVEPSSVLATHLTELVRIHADELLSREEVGHLLDQLKESAPRLVEETIPAVVKPGELQKVLQNLLRERVPIRDLETILETVGDWSVHTRDVGVLTEYARNALRRTISSQYAVPDESGTHRLWCVTLDPVIEDMVNGYVERGAGGTTVAVPPLLADRIAAAVSNAAEGLVARGHQLVLVTSPSVRWPVRQLLAGRLPGSVVLAYNEIVDGLDVESVALVQLPSEESGERSKQEARPMSVV